MSDATKKLSRKDLHLGEPDEFVSLTNRVVDWARANSQAVGIAAVVLAGLLVVAGIWSWVRQSREARAGREFYAASELYKRSQWEPAEQSFAAIADGLGGTSYGRFAMVYAGRSALRAGRNAEAAGYFRQYLGAGVPDLGLEQLTRIDLASALEATGDTAAAREELQRASAIDGPAKGEAVLQLARLEENSGAKEKALELFQQYLADYPDGVGRDLARARVVALGGTPPAAPSRLPPGFPAGQLPPGMIQAQ